MKSWLLGFLFASVVAFGVSAPVWACGPFLYDNAELDRFSLLDPGILNSTEWVNFLAFASPAFGQESSGNGDQKLVQVVIQPDRLPDTAPEGVSNLLYDYNPGSDPILVSANEAWWTDYFLTVRKKTLAADELQKVLYGPERPKWLAPADRSYLEALDGASDDSSTLKKALSEARNIKNPIGLRHRWAFWAVRAQVLKHDDALKLFREFSPGPAGDLPLARAQGWVASSLVETDPGQALKLWVDLFARWPVLRTQTFSSLQYLDSQAWTTSRTKEALVAKFFLDGRDFSPETLGALAEAEKASGGNGTWTESVFYAMAEQVERESGVFALFGLVDPHEVSPHGLFTGLVDKAQALVEQGVQPATRTWWLVASYLALFDGDVARSAALLDRARTLPSLNRDQDHQSDLLAALIQMEAEKEKDWSPSLQSQVVAALDWGKSLDAPGHNRGLYHSVAVLVAQKELARGHNPQAVMAFGLVQKGGWGNPYRVDNGDGFWSTGWPFNNAVNLMMDALMTDEDLSAWKGLLHAADLDPLSKRLVSQSLMTGRDIIWWQAHRALRRGQGEQALSLLKTLGTEPDVESSLFQPRQFSYSVNLDPLDPLQGRGMRTVSPMALAGLMASITAEARTKPSSRSLLTLGQFWLSLQFSGMPLLFSQPPKVISFVNGNFEYYGYDGRDTGRTTALVGTFPLGQSNQTDAWARRLAAFYRNEFSTLGRARQAFEAVVARHDDPDAEFRALLFLQAIDHDRYDDLSDSRYENLPLAEDFRSSCEDFQNFTPGTSDQKLPLQGA